VVYATILYWQPRDLALVSRSIESLLSQGLDGPLFSVDLRIILVDNGCGRTPEWPAGAPVELVRLPSNAGFAGGQNAAIRRALAEGADYVLLFNSDAVAEASVVRTLVSVAERWPSAACVGPLVVRSDHPDTVESAGQSFNVRTGRHLELGRGRDVAHVSRTPRRVDAVSGCALLARREALETLGLLDDALFAYFEDMDWCLRARRARFDVLVVPDAHVRHVGAGSTDGPSPLSTYYAVRNHLLVAGRYTARARLRIVAPLIVIYHLAHALTSPPRRTPRHMLALARGVAAAWALRSRYIQRDVRGQGAAAGCSSPDEIG
jgi:GT2 family glycosyltransferase